MDDEVTPIATGLSGASIRRGCSFLVGVRYNNAHILVVEAANSTLTVNFTPIRIYDIVDGDLVALISIALSFDVSPHILVNGTRIGQRK